MPGSQRFHLRLNAPVQGFEDHFGTEVTLSGILSSLGVWLNLLFGVTEASGTSPLNKDNSFADALEWIAVD